MMHFASGKMFQGDPCITTNDTILQRPSYKGSLTRKEGGIISTGYGSLLSVHDKNARSSTCLD